MIHAMMARTVRTMPINQTCIGRIMALAHLWASTRIRQDDAHQPDMHREDNGTRSPVGKHQNPARRVQSRQSPSTTKGAWLHAHVMWCAVVSRLALATRPPVCLSKRDMNANAQMTLVVG